MTDNNINMEQLSVPSKQELEDLEKNVKFFKTQSGCRLAYHEYGDPSGHPMIFYHGTGSHVHGMLLHKPAIENGFRIIAPDRPGVAKSDFRKGWTIIEYAHDIADLADHLEISTFGAIGISGGGPTLMASAFAIPDRLNCVIDLACAMPLYNDPNIVKQLGSADRFYAKIGSKLPLGLFKIPFSILGILQKLLKSPKTFIKMFASSLCDADKAIFAQPDFQYLFMRDFQELFLHGSKGPAYDAQTVYKNWGFNLADIKIHIEVFQGTADLFIPMKFSEFLENSAKNVRLNLIKDQGHFYHVAYGYQLLSKVKELFYSGKKAYTQTKQ
jgi:pimeloyl-ACP methyl ester carboxylesterase